MRAFPPLLAEKAMEHGLEIHNYYTAPYYAEVLIPAKLAGCMIRGDAKTVNGFLLLFDSGQLDEDERGALVRDLEVHSLGMVRKNVETAVCFPDWQYESEEHA